VFLKRARQVQGVCEQGSPWRLQTPQLGLQQTKPVLQVCMPHDWLSTYWISFAQRRWSQVSPGETQIPQLALQQSSPTLHVFGPQFALPGMTGIPQTSCEQVCPGLTQVPQLSLQQI
jgi:hypothetical protein